MANVMLAWELGHHFGHLARGLVFAKALADLGAHVILAPSATQDPLEAGLAAKYKIVAAPRLKQCQYQAPLLNYASILLRCGWSSAEELGVAVQAWIDLYRQHRINVVLYDHAPTALLAARIIGLPVVLMGSGFEIPPAIAPLPRFAPNLSCASADLALAERLALESVNAVCNLWGGSPFGSIAQLFHSRRVYLTTYQEFDPYIRGAEIVYLGPQSLFESKETIDWKTTRRSPATNILVYARAAQGGLRLLQHLDCYEDLNVIAYVPDLPSPQPQWSNIRNFSFPLDLEALLEFAHLVVTSGGTTAAIAAGRGVPVLELASNMEQYLIGVKLQQLGIGRVVDQRYAQDFAITALLRSMAGEEGIAKRARVFAAGCREFTQQRAIDLVTADVLSCQYCWS